jgi:hypothetical protein
VTCRDCTAARTRTWGQYNLTCPSCLARNAARSQAAYDALHPLGTGDRLALRDLIARKMPQVPTADARRMVYEWWQHDHPTEAGVA